MGLVNVYADYKTAGSFCASHYATACATCCGKDNIYAACKPCRSHSCKAWVWCKLSKIGVVNGDVACAKAKNACCMFCTLDEAMAETYNCGNRNTAHKTKASVTFHYSGVSGKESGLLFGIVDSCYVGFDSVFAASAGCGVKQYEFYFREEVLCVVQRVYKVETGKHEDVRAAFDSMCHQVDTGFVVSRVRLEEVCRACRQVVGTKETLDTVPRTLVKRAVIQNGVR